MDWCTTRNKSLSAIKKRPGAARRPLGTGKAVLIGRIEGVSDLYCCLALPPAGAFMTGMWTQIQPRLPESQWYFSENGIKQAGF